ncbi:MAG TPA: TonB-dependent receptor [Azospirillaceae bacterium]|nr:TonB-dependent receptor [Azospirillaceae bacterium]
MAWKRPPRGLVHRIAAGGVAMALSGPVAAQTVDYGTLEQIFGQPVTTSATGTPKLASDVPATMDIITQDDIRRSGAADLPEILRQLAGIDIWRHGMASVDVGMRGYNQYFSPRLLVLVNGRQVYLDHYGMTNWNAIPVEMGEIRQIEVVKGPNAALFGFNAVSGVVNIITFNPLYDDVDTATARVGTQDYRQLSLVKTLRLSDRAGVRLSLGGFNADEFDTGYDTPTLAANYAPFRTEPERRSFSADGLFQLTDSSQFGVELTKVRTRQSEFGPLADMARGLYETSSAKASYTADTPVGLIEAMVYHNRLDLEELSTAFLNYIAHNRTTVARLQNQYRINADHSVRLSTEFRHNEMNTQPILDADIAYSVYSAGGMWDWAVADGLGLTNAVRLDHWRLDRYGTIAFPPDAVPPFSDEDFKQAFTDISVNSGLVARPTAVDTLRLMYSRGLKVPALAEMGYIEVGQVSPEHRDDFDYVFYSGNPLLKPTTANNYEIGWERRLPALNAVLELSLFYQTHENLQGWMGADPTTIRGRMVDFTTGNIGESEAWGGEIGLSGRIGAPWRWGVNYTYETVHDHLDVNQTGITHPILFEDGTPRHRINAHIGYTDGPWEADLFGHYLTGFDTLRWTFRPDFNAYETVRVPAHLVVNGRLGYQLTDSITVALEGLGITEAEHREAAAPAVERRLFVSLTGRF